MRWSTAMAALGGLAGCGRNLAGTWNGDVYCSGPEWGDYRLDARLTLDRDEPLEYGGVLELVAEIDREDGHYETGMRYDALLLKERAAGEQDLVIDVVCLDAYLTRDGEALYEGCDAYPTAADCASDGSEDCVMDAAGWDGEDLIWLEDDGDSCTGGLRR